MKNISLNSSRSKNLSSKSSNYDLLLYVLLFLLIGVGIFLIVYWSFWPNTTQTFRFEEPTLEEVSAIINKEDFFTGDVQNTNRERNQLRIKDLSEKLENDYSKHLSEDFKSQLKSKIQKVNQANDLAWQIALLDKIESYITSLEIKKKQFEVEQPKWLEEEFPNERKEIIKETNKLIYHFYKRFLEQKKSQGYKELTEADLTRPTYVDGKTSNFTSEDIDKCVAHIRAHDKFLYPLINFQGFKGFIGENSKPEGENVIGLTTTDRSELGWGYRMSDNKRKGAEYLFQPQRTIFIEIKKEACFSWKRKNYKWINNIVGSSTLYHNIDWLEIEDTLAHELAHAVINATHKDYMPHPWDKKTKTGGGHGPLHNQFTLEIKEMMRNDPVGKEYKNWWMGESDNDNDQN